MVTFTGSAKISHVCLSFQSEVMENASKSALAIVPLVKPSEIKSRVSAQTIVFIVPVFMISFNCSNSIMSDCSVGIAVSSQRRESNNERQSVTSWRQKGNDPDSSMWIKLWAVQPGITISARVYATRRPTSIPSAAAFNSAPKVDLQMRRCLREKKSMVLHKHDGSEPLSSAQAIMEPRMAKPLLSSRRKAASLQTSILK